MSLFRDYHLYVDQKHKLQKQGVKCGIPGDRMWKKIVINVV